MFNYKSSLRAGDYSFLWTDLIHLFILFRGVYCWTHHTLWTKHTNKHYRQFGLNEKFIWICLQKVSISILIRLLYWSVYESVSSVTNVGLLALWCTIYVCSSRGVFLRDGLCPIWNWCHHGLICIPDSMDLLPSFSSLSSIWLNVFPPMQYLTVITFLFPGDLKIIHLFYLIPPPILNLWFQCLVVLSRSILCVFGIQHLQFLDKHPVRRIIPVVVTM